MFINYQLGKNPAVCNDDYHNVIALIHSMLVQDQKRLMIIGAGAQPNQANRFGFIDLLLRAKKNEFDPDFFIDQIKAEIPGSDFVMYRDGQPNKYHFIFGFDEAQDFQIVKHDIQPALISLLNNKLGSSGRVLKQQQLQAGILLDLNLIPEGKIWETVKNDEDALPYPITDIISNNNEVQTHQKSDEELIQTLKNYLEETHNTLSYGDSLTRLLISIAHHRGDPEPFLNTIQPYVDRDIHNLYEHVKNRHMNVPSLDQFYIMPEADRQMELGVFLLKQTGAIANEDAEIDAVFHLLQHTFQWGINANLEGTTGYSDGLLIFDPRVGYWVNDPNIVKNLVQTVKPYATDSDVERIRDQLTTYARNHSLIIDPYAGSRFLLFNNCVLDVKTMTELSLDSDYVKQLKFTERSHLNLNYVKNAPNIVFHGHRAYDDGDWTPEDFISAYAGNDPAIRDYLLFCLSLSLFSGHNFGVTVDIQGSSGWGKTTLSRPLRFLHRHNHEMVFHELNEKFPFTSYHPETGLIWLRECNTDSNRLSSTGTSLYDTLCDEMARFNVKGTGDLTIAHPPTVYVDGTSLIHADDLGTGPSRRTLPICLPKNSLEIPKNPHYTKDGQVLSLQQQLYNNSINEDLVDERTLQYLVTEMIKSYRKIINLDIIDDLKINLNHLKSNGLQFPAQVDVWRKQFVASSNEIHDWFVDDIYPCLSLTQDGTLMHNTVLYAMYKEWRKSVYAESTKYQSKDIMPQPKFEALLEDLFREFDLTKIEVGRLYANYNKLKKRVTNLSRTRFRIDTFEQYATGKIPEIYQGDHPNIYPFRAACTGWYQLIIQEDKRKQMIEENKKRSQTNRQKEQQEEYVIDDEMPIEFED